MDERATGLILRTQPLTDTSLIVQWITPDLGRVSTVAKGARRPKSPFAGKLDLFFECEFSFVRSRRSELHTLREARLVDSHPALREDLERLQMAAYAAALIQTATETDTPLPDHYALLSEFIREITGRPPRPLTLFALEIKTLEIGGMAPDLSDSALNPGARQILEKCRQSDWATLARLVPSPGQERDIARFLGHFIEFNLERLPRGRDVCLSSVFKL